MKKAMSIFLALCMVVSLSAYCGKTASAEAVSESEPTYREEFESMEEIIAYFENLEGSDFVKGYLSDLTCINEEYVSGVGFVSNPVDNVMTISETEITIDGKSYPYEEVEGYSYGSDEWEYEFGSWVKETAEDGSTYKTFVVNCFVRITSAKDLQDGNYGSVNWNGDLAIIVFLDDEDETIMEELNLPNGFSAFPSRFGTLGTAKEEPKVDTISLAGTGMFDIISLGSYNGQELEWLVVAQDGNARALMCLQAVDWITMGNNQGTYEDTNIYAFVNGGFLSGFDSQGKQVTSVTLVSPEELDKIGAPSFESLMMLPEEDYYAGKTYWTTIYHNNMSVGILSNDMATFDKYCGMQSAGGSDVRGLLPLIWVED